MNKLKKTLMDIKRTGIDFILTRFFQSYNKISDLDILVKGSDFEKLIIAMQNLGYEEFSHDQALGGRIKGMQKNLVKKGRIKIDLHKDFTWRKSKYIDAKIIWDSKSKDKIGEIEVYRPSNKVNTFLVYVNILFEKTYITADERNILKHKKTLIEKEFITQAKKHNWEVSLRKLISWLEKTKNLDFPVFLPLSLVLYTYFEKFVKERRIDVTSFLYYVFFRTRYFITGKLPY